MPPMTAPAKSMTLILGLSLGLHFPDQPVHHKISIVLYLRRLLALFNLREIIHDFVQRASAQLLAEDLGHDPVRERFDHIRTGGNHGLRDVLDRKSTRLNSSHSQISYAVFCLKKKNI